MGPDRFRFPSAYRLTRTAELTTVLREGKHVRTKLLDVRAIASPLAHPRVGIVVAKRQRTTTDRNRLKRRLRELVRLYVLPALGSIDLVIYTRSRAYDASFVELREDLLDTSQRVSSAVRQKGLEQ